MATAHFLALGLVTALGCDALSPAVDRPEFPIDQPTAISPGNEYRMTGTRLRLSNMEVVSGPAVEFRVVFDDERSRVHLEEKNGTAFWGGYTFVLKSLDPRQPRAVIVVSHKGL